VCEQSGLLNVAKAGASQKFKRKWVVLKHGHITVWKNPDDKKPKTDLEITLESAVTDVPVLDEVQAEKNGYPFTLKFGKRSLSFATQTAAERALWISVRLLNSWYELDNLRFCHGLQAFTTELAIQRAAADIFEDCAKEVAKQYLPLPISASKPGGLLITPSGGGEEMKRRGSAILPPSINLEAVLKKQTEIKPKWDNANDRSEPMQNRRRKNKRKDSCFVFGAFRLAPEMSLVYIAVWLLHWIISVVHYKPTATLGESGQLTNQVRKWKNKCAESSWADRLMQAFCLSA